MTPEFIGSAGLVIGFFIGLSLREIARFLRGLLTTYPAETFAQAEDIGDAGAGDSRIMVSEATRRRNPPETGAAKRLAEESAARRAGPSVWERLKEKQDYTQK